MVGPVDGHLTGASTPGQFVQVPPLGAQVPTKAQLEYPPTSVMVQ
jgi:hypothetical protein